MQKYRLKSKKFDWESIKQDPTIKKEEEENESEEEKEEEEEDIYKLEFKPLLKQMGNDIK